MEKTFNKLIRDKIPEIIDSNGEIAITKVLSSNDYKKELYKKLLEEANEVINAGTTDDVLEELADVFEVIRSIAELNNRSFDDIVVIANKKRLKRGGFQKRIFLEKTVGKK